jgi:hypothetical protein
MLKKIIPALAVLAIFITACGPQGTPTLAPAEVEGTAVSSAWTVVAMTQLAIPTASPTPLPTFTPLPLPTLESTPLVLATATQQAAGSSGGTCDGLMNVGEAGPKSNIRLENESGGVATVSLWLGTPNAFGQCGFIPGITPLAKGEKRVLSIPKGEYYAYALIALGGNSSSSAWGYVNNRIGDDHQFGVKIRKDQIVVP